MYGLYGSWRWKMGETSGLAVGQCQGWVCQVFARLCRGRMLREQWSNEERSRCFLNRPWRLLILWMRYLAGLGR